MFDGAGLDQENGCPKEGAGSPGGRTGAYREKFIAGQSRYFIGLEEGRRRRCRKLACMSGDLRRESEIRPRPGKREDVRAGTAMVRLARKFPFGGVNRRAPRHGRGITRAGRYGGLDGDVAVGAEAEHAFPRPADSRQEDGQKDSPCDDCRFSKTPHAASLAPKTIKKHASPFRATCNDANRKAKFYLPP